MSETNGTIQAAPPVTPTEPTELYLKYRPQSFDEIVGQPEAVAQLKEMVRTKKVPHVVAFFGPSGCGKTTCARVLKRYLGCKGKDFQEINAASSRGIDTVRDIQARMGLMPMSGKSRVYLIDEVGKWTPDAQAAMLKTLEDTPKHCYFLLATTDPQKLLSTIISRCTEIKIKLLSVPDLTKMVQNVCAQENIVLTEKVLQQLVDVSDGNGRKSLVLLHQIRGLIEEQAQLDALQKEDVKKDAFAIVKALIWEKPSWDKVRALLVEINERTEDVERLRHLVMACAKKELLKPKGNHERAQAVGKAFSYNWYDCKEVGLELACWEVLGSFK